MTPYYWLGLRELTGTRRVLGTIGLIATLIGWAALGFATVIVLGGMILA